MKNSIDLVTPSILGMEEIRDKSIPNPNDIKNTEVDPFISYNWYLTEY